LTGWRTYLRWHLARTASPYLSRAFVEKWFAFVRTLTGVQTLQPRWKRCVRIIDRGMGEAWMDEPTRIQAEAKLAKVTNQVGFPSKWRIYDGLIVERGPLLADVFAAPNVVLLPC
jgi:predicted metalloendopeptidase